MTPMFYHTSDKMKCCLVVALIAIATGAALGAREAVPDHNPVKKPHEQDGEHNAHYDHEAIIGSRREEEEFDDLDPEEAKQKLTFMVARNDENNDEVISKPELVEWVMKSFKSLDEEDAREKFHDLDNDKEDNRIGWKEFLKSQFNYEPVDVEEFKKLRTTEPNDPKHKETFELLDLIEEEEEKFMAADANSDGFLTLEEYYAFHNPFEYERMHDFEVKRMMKSIDLDKDGTISKQEYIGDTTDQETILSEEENFKSHDKDGDGKLSELEIREWVIQDNRKAAEEEASHLISIADDNQNDELSLPEIVDHYEAFVGSQVTDYGKHLDDEL